MLQFVRGSAGASGSKQAAGADGLPGHDCKGERQIQVTSVGRGRWSSIRMDAPGRFCMRNVSLTSLAPWKTGVPGASQLTTLRRSVPSGPPLAPGLLGSIKRLWAGAAGPQRSA